MTNAAAMDISDGVFLHLPEDTYHAIPALSASGMKNLLISPMDYWANSFMNPLRDDEDDKDWMVVGHAYHKRILEGKEAFAASYGPVFQAPKDTLETVDEMKEALAKAGVDLKTALAEMELPVPSKAKRPDLVAVVRRMLPDVKIIDDERAAYAEQLGDRIPLGADTFAKIEIAAAMIERNPELARCFRGGYPEVSVLWTEDGIRMKARFDYLKPKAIIDLKTFVNTMGKTIDNAIYAAMASKKYHIQFTFYMTKAIEAAKRFVAAGAVDGAIPDDWKREFLATEEHGFYSVFQQKGVAPLARGWKFERGSMFTIGQYAIEKAIGTYKECLERFGTDPWVDTSPIETFRDDQFPVYATEL